ncbi:5'-nucleotidase domain-containing protein 1, partial [Ophiophagus hannah]
MRVHFRVRRTIIEMLSVLTHTDENINLIYFCCCRNDFEDLFDIIITNALKPGFFSRTPNQRPFRTLENDEEQEALPTLDKPGWYSQGNSTHLCELLKKMTGRVEPKCLFIFQGHQPKALHSISKQWGSFFVDTISGKENEEEILVNTWSCKSVHTYSTITIPSIEAIAEEIAFQTS